jgi:hypothetical protein
MTPLDKALKRSLKIKDVDYVITMTPETLKLTIKGRRLGVELKWADLISGESALAVALHASVGQFEIGDKNSSKKNPEYEAPRPKPTPRAIGRPASRSPPKRTAR